MVKVLVVDDSRVFRDLITQVLEEEDDIKVIAAAADGNEALAAIAQEKPDVITSDLFMPNMDGLQLTRQVMSSTPIPMLIVTSHKNSAKHAFNLLEAGALAVMEKPAGYHDSNFEICANRLRTTIRTLSKAKLVRRWERKYNKIERPKIKSATITSKCAVIAIGASTGGPQVIKQIVSALPPDFPVPILLTQHMANGFIDGMASWLNESKTIKAKVAQQGEVIEPGYIYLAPYDCHMELSADKTIALTTGRPEYGMRPSVAKLFSSVAQHFGHQSVGVILSGMGKDGSRELALFRDKGSPTIAQDRESSVVYGMPGEAVALGSASEILPADKIAERLIDLVCNVETPIFPSQTMLKKTLSSGGQ